MHLNPSLIQEIGILSNHLHQSTSDNEIIFVLKERKWKHIFLCLVNCLWNLFATFPSAYLSWRKRWWCLWNMFDPVPLVVFIAGNQIRPSWRKVQQSNTLLLGQWRKVITASRRWALKLSRRVWWESRTMGLIVPAQATCQDDSPLKCPSTPFLLLPPSQVSMLLSIIVTRTIYVPSILPS